MSTQEWHPVILPSLGVYYDGKCPGGEVEITPWTTAQEEKLVRYASQPGLNRANLIYEMIEAGVRLPKGMVHDDLMISDQHYLLMKLRAISLIAIYTVDYKCPECKASHETSFNIDELPVKSPEPEETDDTFTVSLPRCGQKVTLRLLRVRDEKKISEYKQKKVDAGLPDADEELYRYRLARQVSMVDGESIKFDEKKDFLGGLIMLDLAIIKQEIEDREMGIDTEVRVKCPRCGCIEDWDIPIQISFFRPKRADLAAAVRMVGNVGA